MLRIADPDLAFPFDADLDPTFPFDADPDPSFQIKGSKLWKSAQIGSYFIHLAYHLQIDADEDPAHHFDADADLNPAYHSMRILPFTSMRIRILGSK